MWAGERYPGECPLVAAVALPVVHPPGSVDHHSRARYVAGYRLVGWLLPVVGQRPDRYNWYQGWTETG